MNGIGFPASATDVTEQMGSLSLLYIPPPVTHYPISFFLSVTSVIDEINKRGIRVYGDADD
jgi:hypothetical protein